MNAINPEDAARWKAWECRDVAARFVYAVRSTGIYCRPSCKARRAKRENIAFYATGAEAERAGFRPCRRCRPEEPAGPASSLALECCRRIEAALEAGEPVPPLAELAGASGLSRFHLLRLFKSATGMTPKAYASACRAWRARRELAGGAAVTEAIYGAGYGSPRGFYEQAALGMAPRRFRKGGEGETIRFATGRCSLGAFLVAATEAGICAVSLGDDAEALARELRDRFAKAWLIGADAEFEALIARVVGLIEAPGRAVDLPLDIRGTLFQHRVWQALREIPAGETVNYTGIAARIGAPKACRAVARACAENPLAVVVPCHRVVRRDGALSGYRWGIARKRALLDREGGG